MATEWEGKSRGTVLGYRIFVFLIQRFGPRTAYVLLYLVVPYFSVFSWQGTRAIYYYLRKRQGYSRSKSILGIFENYNLFGRTLIDKTAIAGGLRNAFTYEFDGVERIQDLLDKGKGGIMISAHIGNFDIADFFFDELDAGSKIYLVTTDAEHEQIKAYLDSVTQKSRIGFIIVRDDLAHIFQINDALGRGALVCFTGDRYFHGQKTMVGEFLGKTAQFPAGPFLLAAKLKVPVLFVYVMKENSGHYHLYARQAKARDAQGILGDYIQSMEGMLARYPLQWFNYFDFWKALGKS